MMVERPGGAAQSEPVSLAPLLVLEPAPGVREVRLNRPEVHNALDGPLLTQLLKEVLDASTDDSVRSILISGADPSFCAGDDLEEVEASFAGRGDGVLVPGTPDAMYLRIAEALLHAPKPVVAAIQGVCVGAGTELACAADLRIARDDLRVGSALVKVGHVGNAALLPRVVGVAKASEIFLTGRLLDSSEALNAGLVSEVLPAERFRDRGVELASSLATGPTRSIGMYKELRERALNASVEESLRLQAIFHERCGREVRDAAVGVRAFLEKRQPKFTGR